jgi:hypothetical protein
MKSQLLRVLPILLTALLSSCGAPQPPSCSRVPSGSRSPATSLLANAQSAWVVLADRSQQAQWATAQDRYNVAVAQLFDQLRCGPGSWESRASALGTRLAAADARSADVSRLDAVFPAAVVKIRASMHHQTTAGIGVPLVGWKKTTALGMARESNALPTGLPYNLTATLAFDRKSQPTWQFTKRWLYNDLSLGKARHPLAADWTAPNAFFWQMCDLDDLKIQNVILPGRFSEEIGLYFLQPYNPKKIPLVLIHGLVSSPDAFKNLINELAPEPWFRERYQVWLFNYPTGNPWLYSGLKFREKMRTACSYARSKGDDRNLKQMVLIGHSMGGLIARSSVTQPGTKFYDAVFKRPIDELKVTVPTRKLIRDATLYQPLTEPKRVVFLAVPHRGSPLANLRISVWFSRLIRLPKQLTVELLDATVQGVNDALKGDQAKPNMPNSISSLSPKDKSNIALSHLPLPPAIHFHSVIGDRGKADSPNSSDGVVPYGSSHVAPVDSELIVHCNHSVPDCPATSAEIRRILLRHLQAP